MLLPHELYSWFADKPMQFDARLLGGSYETCRDWFAERRNEPWFKGSAIEQRLDADVRVVPIMLYGDDAELQKRESALILTWSSPMQSNLGVRKMKMPITVVPLRLATATTMKQIYALIRWSFQLLWHRKWPRKDPFGQDWTDWREAMAGEWLDPRHHSAATLVEVCGD